MAGIKYKQLVDKADARTNGAFTRSLLEPNGQDGSMLFIAGAMAAIEILADMGVVTDIDEVLDGEDCIANHQKLAEQAASAQPLSINDLITEMYWQNPSTRKMREEMVGEAKFDSIFCVAVTFMVGHLMRTKMIPMSNAKAITLLLANLAKTHAINMGQLGGSATADDIIREIKKRKDQE